MSTSTPETLPPHLEQAPALPTVQAEAPKPKAHRLKPIHLATLNRAQADAQKIIREAQDLVADDLGVAGNFRLSSDPSGATFLVEKGP